MKKILLIGLLVIFSSGCVTTSTPGVPFTFEPSAKGSYPGVIVLHTSGGLQKHEIDYARMLSTKGFVIAVVDYDARGGTDNVANAYNLLTKHPMVAGNSIGMVGFSKGARVAMSTAWYGSKFDNWNIGAIVSYYIGPALGGSTGPEMPPILFLHGDLDSHVSEETIVSFCKLQVQYGKTCKANIYKNIKHAFNLVYTIDNHQGYDAPTSELADKQAIEFLNNSLKK